MTRNILLFVFTLFFTHTIYAEQLIIEPDMGRAPVLSQIENAKSSIDVIMYGFTDKEFINALITAKRKQKEIHVLLEKSPYKSDGENNKAIQQLQKANIPIQYGNPEFQLTHQKTIVIDHHNAIIMTFNLTHSAFKDQRNFAIITDDPAIVREIETVLHADWDHKKISV